MARIALYTDNLFAATDDPATNAAQLAALQGSGFNTLIIWAITVPDASGTLHYAGQPIVENGALVSAAAYLQPLFAALRSSQSDGTPSTVNTILFSIGVGKGKGPPPQTWNNIAALLGTTEGSQTLANNFLALSAALGIDGFDYDMEYYFNWDAIVQFTELVTTPNPAMITFCPYNNVYNWVNTLPQIYTWDQGQTPVPFGQSVQWLNVQEYGGGSPALTPQFQSAVSGTVATGITDPTTFVVPGYDITSPSDVQSFFYDQAYSYKVDSGFLFNSNVIFTASPYYTVRQYAQAIIDGLASGAAPGAKATGVLKKLREKRAGSPGNRGNIGVPRPPADAGE